MAKIGDVLARKTEQLPQFDYLFRVDLPDISPNGFSVEFPSPNASRGFANASDISHRVYSINAPLTEWETKKNTNRDTFFYTTHNSDIGSVSMRMDEYEDGKTLDYLLAWQELFGDNTGRNAPAVYKGNIRVIRMSSVLSDVHVHYYTGYFPNAISPMAFSYENNSVLQYEVTFTGDDVVHMMIPAGIVKSVIEAEHRNISSELMGDSTTEGPLSKIQSVFKPSIDQIRSVVSEFERFT